MAGLVQHIHHSNLSSGEKLDRRKYLEEDLSDPSCLIVGIWGENHWVVAGLSAAQATQCSHYRGASLLSLPWHCGVVVSMPDRQSGDPGSSPGGATNFSEFVSGLTGMDTPVVATCVAITKIMLLVFKQL